MKTSFVRWGLLALACLAISACKQQRDPVKPTTGQAVAQVTIR